MDAGKQRRVKQVIGVAVGMLVITGLAAVAATRDGSIQDESGMARAALPARLGVSSSGGANAADSAAAAKVGASAPAGAGSAAGSAISPDGGALPVGLGQPQVVKTAVLQVEVGAKAFDAALERVGTVATTAGGFVAESTSQRGDDDASRSASVVVRVPAEAFESTRAALAGLGELRSQLVRGQDVSAQLVDLEARLRNLRSTEDALRLLMAKAGTVGETIEVQRQLTDVRGQIERLAAEQTHLADAAAMSTLTVGLIEPGAAAAPSDPSPLGRSFARAAAGAQWVIALLVVSVGYLLPLAVLAGLAMLVVRRTRRRSPAPAPTTAPSSSA